MVLAGASRHALLFLAFLAPTLHGTPPIPCTDEATCPPSYACIRTTYSRDGVCLGLFQAACQDTMQCYVGVCMEGVCSPPPTCTLAQCPSCTSQGFCTVADGELCAVHAQCASGLCAELNADVGRVRKCMPRFQSSCMFNHPDGRILDNCTAVSMEYYCSKFNTCVAVRSVYCDPLRPVGCSNCRAGRGLRPSVCVPQFTQLGDSCDKDDHRACATGVCRKMATGGSVCAIPDFCSLDRHCGSPRHQCVAGKCQASWCTGNYDCISSEVGPCKV